MEHLFQLGGLVCGQQIDHTWVLGGVPLPVCQRCTGLFVGAFYSVVLGLGSRPRLTRRFLLIHGGFLVSMAPFGLHWVEDGPGFRTMTGILYGAAVAVFLGALPLTLLSHQVRRSLWQVRGTANRSAVQGSGASLPRGNDTARTYWLGLGAGVAGLMLGCGFGGAGAAFVVTGLTVAGQLALAALVVLFASSLIACLVRLIRRRLCWAAA